MNIYNNQLSALSLRLKYSLLLLGILVVIMLYDGTVLSVILRSVADAYLQVSAFVFAALYIFYLLEKLLNINALALLAEKKWEVPFAAFLGALPGCGGAIIVTTQYVKGKQSFGAFTAALIATMGDAAFLLIAREPLTGLMIIALGFVIGFLFGVIVNYIHGPDFMRGKESRKAVIADGGVVEKTSVSLVKTVAMLDKVWLFWMIPGVIFAIMLAAQFSFEGLLEPIMLVVGVVGACLCWGMYVVLGQEDPSNIAVDASNKSSSYRLNLRNFIDDTNFVTVWVILAFLLFEVSVHLLQFDLRMLFNTIAPLVPLVAILIGFIPGCGPQILVTTLYLEGFIPLSALLGNAISNDGDALFPALALAKKAAIMATLYSAVPALLLSYGYYILVE